MPGVCVPVLCLSVLEILLENPPVHRNLSGNGSSSKVSSCNGEYTKVSRSFVKTDLHSQNQFLWPPFCPSVPDIFFFLIFAILVPPCKAWFLFLHVFFFSLSLRLVF